METGKRWVREACERISNERLDTVVLVRWDAQDNDPACHLHVQLAGYDAEVLSFTRGTLRSCGDSRYSAVRQRVEAAIRERLTRTATDAG